jgi:hypothetical protein
MSDIAVAIYDHEARIRSYEIRMDAVVQTARGVERQVRCKVALFRRKLPVHRR